jgi:hypothetical protein
MKQSEFFQKHSHKLIKVANDDSEYGDFLILHPEEIPMAKELESRGFTVVSVHESEDGDNNIDFENPFDYGSQPYKIGYYAINNNNNNYL